MGVHFLRDGSGITRRQWGARIRRTGSKSQEGNLRIFGTPVFLGLITFMYVISGDGGQTSVSSGGERFC
jgi:hypothetical protein